MPWCVDITEFELGQGSRLDETVVFKGVDDGKAEASRYSAEYNAKYNTAPTAPDWYMVASQPYFLTVAPTGSKVTHHVPVAQTDRASAS